MHLRVAQISTTGTFLPEYYGSNEYILCRGLAKLGHDVTLFVADKLPKWQTLSRKIDKRTEKYDGFTVKRLYSGPEIGIVPLIPNLFTTLLEMDFDIIHAHDFFAASSFYAALASGTKVTPFILTQHNDKSPSKIVNYFLYQFNSKSLGFFVFAHASRIIALNTAIKNHLLAMGADKKKLTIIPNAIDTCLFNPNRENLLKTKWGISGSVILFVGRLVKEKGLRSLLVAFATVVKKIPDANLVIVGKGPQEQELKQLQNNLKLSNVFFLGAIETKFMPNIYAGCDLLVLPSIQEPFGNVVIEAMATGKPVIGSYVGGIKDTIIHGITGYHILPGNSQQISDYIIKLLNNKSLKKKLGQNARIRALEQYDHEQLIQRIERIYTSAIEKN